MSQMSPTASSQKSRVDGEVLLVGSLPFDDAETAMRTAGEALGDLLPCLPDGEPGERKFFIIYGPEEIFSKHPDLVETHRPNASVDHQPAKDDPDAVPGSQKEFQWTFAIKESVEELTFDLGYGRFALESYEVFKRLRDEGAIAKSVKFMVAVPSAMTGVDVFFADLDDRNRAEQAYIAAIAKNVEEMLEVIPADDLVIQLDAANEICDIAIGDRFYYDFMPERTQQEKIDKHMDLLNQMLEAIPEEVAVGYHWCYGTWGGWPMVAMEDLSLCVNLSNMTAKMAGRQLDFVHLPAGETADDKFFAPLKDLDIGSTKLYLGIIHHHDEAPQAFRDRVATVKKYRDDFGVAAVCGYGRTDPSEVGDIFAMHKICAEVVRDS